MSFASFFRILPSARFCLGREILSKQISAIRQCEAVLFHISASKKNEANVESSDYSDGNLVSLRKYYAQYFQNNSSRYPSIFRPDKYSQDFSGKTLKLLKQFEFKSVDVQIKSDLKLRLKEELSGLSYDEFLAVLNFFVGDLLTKYDTNDSNELIHTLDNECLSRTHSLSVDENLKILHVLCNTKSFLKFTFFSRKIFKYCYKVKHLNSNQIIHLLYLLLNLNKTPPKEAKFGFQEELSKIIPHLNIHELGLMSFVIYKLQINHPKFFNSILPKALSEVESLDLEIVYSFSLGFTKVTSNHFKSLIHEFQEKTMPLANKLDMPTLTNLVSSGLINNCVNLNLLQELLRRVKQNISENDSIILQRCFGNFNSSWHHQWKQQTELKSSKKLLLLCAKFNIKDEDFIKLVLTECYRRPNFSPNHLVTIGKYLICLGVLDKKIFDQVLTENFINELFAKNFKVALLDLQFIENSIEIEMPNYVGPKISEMYHKKIYKISRKFDFYKSSLIDRMNPYFLKSFDYISGELQNVLNKIYGENEVFWKKLISSYHPFCLMRFNENLKPQSIPEEFLKSKTVKVLRPLQDNHFWVPVVLIFPMDMTNDQELNLIIQTKIRHLKIIGYKPLLLHWYAWNSHKKNKTEEEFLKNLFTTHLEKNLKSQTQIMEAL